MCLVLVEFQSAREPVLAAEPTKTFKFYVVHEGSASSPILNGLTGSESKAVFVEPWYLCTGAESENSTKPECCYMSSPTKVLDA